MALQQSQAKFIHQVKTALSGGQTVFNFDTSVPTDPTALLVLADGIGIDNNFSITGASQITLNSGVAIGVEIEAIHSTAFSVVNSGAVGNDGAIQFATAGNLNSNVSKLFWDNILHNLGIDRPSPAESLEVTGNILATRAFVIPVVADEAIAVARICKVSGTTDERLVLSGGSNPVLGVSETSTAGAGETFNLAVNGITKVRVSNAFSRGHFLKPGAVLGSAESNGVSQTSITFAQVLSSGIAGDTPDILFLKN